MLSERQFRGVTAPALEPNCLVETLGTPFINCGIWAKCPTALGLSFPICIKKITLIPTSQGCYLCLARSKGGQYSKAVTLE